MLNLSVQTGFAVIGDDLAPSMFRRITGFFNPLFFSISSSESEIRREQHYFKASVM